MAQPRDTPDDRRLVYSTDGTLPVPNPRNSKPPAPRKGARVPEDGVVRVGCERRRGGIVTLVYGLGDAELEPTAAALKRRCGTGGTVKNGIVELQGDRRDAVLAYLSDSGRRAKRMGG